MELELTRTGLGGFQMVMDRTVVQEETQEGIVPDTCPDILRIVDAAGQVTLTGRELSQGSLRVTGTVRAAALYIPEGEEGPRHMDISIPFLCTVDDPALHSGCKAWAVPRLCSVDARTVNPRKVLVRAEVAVEVRAFAPEEQTVCTGAVWDGGELQKKMVEREVWQVRTALEKAFTFSDLLDLPASRPRAAALLRSRVQPRGMEARVIGSKLVVKGEVELTVLYRTESGDAATGRFELPYSQIMEVSGVGEESDALVELALTGLECTLQPGDPGSIAVTLEMLAQAAVCERHKTALLADLYATSCPLEVEWEAMEARRFVGRETRRESVRQFCECGIPAHTVVDAFLSVGRVAVTGEGVRADTSVTVLFLSEDGALCSVTYPIPAQTGPAGEDVPLCRCAPLGELTAVPVTGGLEVRFEMGFDLLTLHPEPCPFVGSVRVLPQPEGGGERPSVVLRMVEEGEELWDIAKGYQSTIEDIAAANGLDGDRAPKGVLLIPRRR